MKFVWRRLRHIEHFLLGIGVFGAFAVLVLGLALGWPLNLVGWCFATIGVGLIVPRLLAAVIWRPEEAKVLEVESYDGGQSVRFRYFFDGEPYLGEFSGTWRKRPGDTVQLYVNPERPTQFFGMSVLVLFLGVAFVFLGIGLATSAPVYSAGWN